MKLVQGIKHVLGRGYPGQNWSNLHVSYKILGYNPLTLISLEILGFSFNFLGIFSIQDAKDNFM